MREIFLFYQKAFSDDFGESLLFLRALPLKTYTHENPEPC